MKIKLLLIAFLGLIGCSVALAASADQADSPVKVTFLEPENFTDLKHAYMDSDRGRDALVDELKKHILSRAAKYLTTGQRLEITITDVDLAGDFEPWHGPQFHDVRIVKDLYPPRVSLQFRLLAADGTVASEGTRQLQDLGYMMSMAWPLSDPLRYDKEMLSDWLRQEFRHS
jgi:hypothetical protein